LTPSSTLSPRCLFITYPPFLITGLAPADVLNKASGIIKGDKPANESYQVK
jgi:hypothetical protein